MARARPVDFAAQKNEEVEHSLESQTNLKIWFCILVHFLVLHLVKCYNWDAARISWLNRMVFGLSSFRASEPSLNDSLTASLAVAVASHLAIAIAIAFYFSKYPRYRSSCMEASVGSRFVEARLFSESVGFSELPGLLRQLLSGFTV